MKGVPLKKIIKVLEANGFVAVRQKGSHRIYRRVAGGHKVTVPVPVSSKTIPVGTAGSIIKLSGLSKADFGVE